MTYIDLINRFWDVNEQEGFSITQISLYFMLLHMFNRSFWTPTIVCSDKKLSACVGISVNSMKRARTVLVERNLIVFKAGGKGYANKTRYQILTTKQAPNLIPSLTPTPLYNKTKKKDSYERNKKSGFVISEGDFEEQ